MNNAPAIWFLLLLCSISLPAAATLVHRWVDADGVTHFSDALPDDAAVDVSTVELDDFPPLAAAEANYYSIANQWKRMREERQAKTKFYLEKARIRARESATAIDAEPLEHSSYGGYPVYTLAHGRHHARASHHHGHRDTVARGPHHVQARSHHIAGAARRAPSPSHRTVALHRPHRSAVRHGSGLSFSFNLR